MCALVDIRYVFQTWKTSQVPEKWKVSHQRWQEFCQKYGFGYVLWDDDQNRQFISSQFPWFLAKYDAYPHGIQRADAVRYFFGFKFGCIYSDLDLAPKLDKFEELHTLVTNHNMATSAFPITVNKVLKDTLTNCFMIIPRGNAFMPKLFDSLINPGSYHWTWVKSVLRETHKFLILFTTGPGIVSDQAILFPELVTQLNVNLISNKNSPLCLMDHAAGKSWHDVKQMRKDCFKLAFVCVALVLFVLVLIGVGRAIVKRAHQKQQHTTF